MNPTEEEPKQFPSFARGYYGIALYQPKKAENFGSLLRTAQTLGAAFIAMIDGRYQRQSSDCYGAVHHVPIFEYDSFDLFYANLPKSCQLVGIEQSPRAQDLSDFKHPLSAVYLLGSESDGLPPLVLERCHRLVQLRGERSLNLAVAGSIVLYHRMCLN